MSATGNSRIEERLEASIKSRRHEAFVLGESAARHNPAANGGRPRLCPPVFTFNAAFFAATVQRSGVSVWFGLLDWAICSYSSYSRRKLRHDAPMQSWVSGVSERSYSKIASFSFFAGGPLSSSWAFFFFLFYFFLVSMSWGTRCKLSGLVARPQGIVFVQAVRESECLFVSSQIGDERVQRML